MKHNTAPYLLNPQHPVTINLIGAGGTGSQVLTNLARMDFALRGLGHPGFMVFCYDPDNISDANIGRQLFSPAEIGMNKAVVLVTKINRFFGLQWESRPALFSTPFVRTPANITISCVDTAAARIEINGILEKHAELSMQQPYEDVYYWLDFGNTQKTGQIILGTLNPIQQANGDCTNNQPSSLPTVIDMFPDIAKQDNKETQGPSCSLAEALSKQDLFINSVLATLGCDLLWKLFREAGTDYRGLFVNLDSMKVNPIPIEMEADTNVKRKPKAKGKTKSRRNKKAKSPKRIGA